MPPTEHPVVVSTREEDSMNNEASMSGRQIIGLIYPPPDIRTIVDKTANFVARNGVDFENKIKEKEAQNPRFSFLSPTDPYNAYYKHKVRELSDGRTAPESALLKPQLPDAVKEVVKKAELIPTKPPPPYEFTADPATINAFDLDLIKLTAMFVARNGRAFLTNLMTREMRNFQFDFLKPAHSNFPYFSKLVEQYTKVMIPSKTIVEELQTEKGNNKKLLSEVNYRVKWEKHQKSLKDKEEAAAEKERVAYSQIDWHDFVVVQTVDFTGSDMANLPGLCTPVDVGARILLEARKDQDKQTADAVEMDMGESDSEEEHDIDNEVPSTAHAHEKQDNSHPDEGQFGQPVPMAPTKHKIVVKEYDPKKAQQRAQVADDWLISPLTGERIPKAKLAEHVRYNTVDSQYKEEREMRLANAGNEEQVFAPGADIGRNLMKFADRRTDIFGVGEEGARQTMIGKKLGETDTPSRPVNDGIWDGTAETMEAATRAAQSKVTLDQQIKELHRQHGFLPDPEKEKIGAKMPGQAPPPARQVPPPMPPPQQRLPPQQPPPPVQQPRTPAVVPVPIPRPLPPMPSAGFPTLPNPGMSVLRPPLGVPVPQMVNIIPMVLPPASAIPAAATRPASDATAQPPAKKQKTEDDLEPENQWAQKVPATLELRVQLPTAPEWQMDGGIVAFTVETVAMVSSLKQKIQDRYQMPLNKQKLTFDGFFLKDASTFAYYNMNVHALVILQQKERGGRKK